MANKITTRLKHGWNAFLNRDPTVEPRNLGSGAHYRPDKHYYRATNEKSIIGSIYSQLANDVASIMIRHVKVDENGRFLEAIDSPLNQCFNTSPNKDQTPVSFKIDCAISLFDEGHVAVIPVDTSTNPNESGSFDIFSLRTAKILEWFPDHVRVRVYDDKAGIMKDIIMEKKVIAIVENPMYLVMNEPNSTLSRLRSKLNILDQVDNQLGSGKLDIIVQLPYVIKTESKRDAAEKRIKDIEMQLTGKYGIAYTDGTEKVTQLNRAVDNNLLIQIQSLTDMLYSQLGLTPEVFNGTADEKTMLNYYNRSILPIVIACVEEFNRKFLTKTSRTRGHRVMSFRDPFKLVPVSEIADIADKFTRNEILSSNEIRAILGIMPSKEPGADELRNKNLNQDKNATSEPKPVESEGDK